MAVVDGDQHPARRQAVRDRRPGPVAGQADLGDPGRARPPVQPGRLRRVRAGPGRAVRPEQFPPLRLTPRHPAGQFVQPLVADHQQRPEDRQVGPGLRDPAVRPDPGRGPYVPSGLSPPAAGRQPVGGRPDIDPEQLPGRTPLRHGGQQCAVSRTEIDHADQSRAFGRQRIECRQ
ncbi:hypothetical protein SDC9_127796 [bioreactor metagenome]|uniref:Uncharacterized protein n=1 Tax=bioreactor metagenome TaxID=1076179 RepID=A0A645CUE8_9ZZZZ